MFASLCCTSVLQVCVASLFASLFACCWQVCFVSCVVKILLRVGLQVVFVRFVSYVCVAICVASLSVRVCCKRVLWSVLQSCVR